MESAFYRTAPNSFIDTHPCLKRLGALIREVRSISEFCVSPVVSMSQTQKYRVRSGTGGRKRGTDTSTFLKRALLLQAELQKKRYPNASSLAAMCGCSRSTAMRTIDRLRYEFGVPIDYDESNRGYYLTNPDFSFASLPFAVSCSPPTARQVRCLSPRSHRCQSELVASVEPRLVFLSSLCASLDPTIQLRPVGAISLLGIEDGAIA